MFATQVGSSHKQFSVYCNYRIPTSQMPAKTTDKPVTVGNRKSRRSLPGHSTQRRHYFDNCCLTNDKCLPQLGATH